MRQPAAALQGNVTFDSVCFVQTLVEFSSDSVISDIWIVGNAPKLWWAILG